MTASLKVNRFTGLQKIAPESIEKSEMEQALPSAQYALDVQLHDLRSEFLHREAKLRHWCHFAGVRVGAGTDTGLPSWRCHGRT